MISKLRSLRAIPATSRLTQRSIHSSSAIRDHFLDVNKAVSLTPRSHIDLDADPKAFEKRALDASSSKPVLVDFYASWCQPCKILTPLLKSVTGPDSGYDLITINVDEEPEVAGQFKVSSIPYVVAFKNGKEVNKFVGYRPEAELKKFLSSL